MNRLTVELLLMGSVCALAFLYARLQFRNLRARVREWLRIQRINAAAHVVGPSAVLQAPKPKVEVMPIQPASMPNPIVSCVTPNVNFGEFDVPTYLRKVSRGIVPSNVVPNVEVTQGAATANKQVVGDEELIIL